MKKIGLISDTHCNIDLKILEFFKDCGEIWHAGDIGDIESAEEIAAFKPLVAVHGNIDGYDIRNVYPENQRFLCEDMYVWITHIGGYPGRYDNRVISEIKDNPPDLFICGHSHILKVIYDKKLNFLHINPGASGKSGLHIVRTAIRFTIEKKEVKDLEILEMKR